VPRWSSAGFLNQLHSGSILKSPAKWQTGWQISSPPFGCCKSRHHWNGLMIGNKLDMADALANIIAAVG
jgi:hypothetical protein